MADQPQPLSQDEFAAKIKAQYPAYASMDNAELTQKVLAKYPVYSQKVRIAPVNSSIIKPVDPSPYHEAAGKAIDKAASKVGGAVNKAIPADPAFRKGMEMGASFALGGGANETEDVAVTMMKKLSSAGQDVKAAMPAAKAAQGFEKLSAVAGHLPVNTTMAAERAMIADKMTEYGNQPVKVINDFLSRVTDPKAKPLTYSEARQFYSSATRLTDEEVSNLKPVMRRQLAKFTQALGKSIEDTVDTAGHLETYKDAMKNYKLAMKLRQAASMAGKTALAAGGAGGAYEIYKMTR